MATPRPQAAAHGTRERLLAVVAARPGIHFRALGRASGCSAGQLRHHTSKLVRAGLLVEVADSRYQRFFIAGRHSPAVRQAVSLLHRPSVRLLAELLLEGPRSRSELRAIMGCAESTLSFNLGLLVAGDLAERGTRGAPVAASRPDILREALAVLGAPPPWPAPPGPVPAPALAAPPAVREAMAPMAAPGAW